MNRTCAWLFLALWSGGTLWGQPPSYSAASIFNTSNQAPGPYAPNSELTILGTGMAHSAYSLTAADIAGGNLPTTLNGVQVMVDGRRRPCFTFQPRKSTF